ncbi:MAG TPA: alpha/beta hydrolase [Chloroflexota bacterium]|nr:alpha/beta hydrolase [Chloroflexota bacterium]
MQPAAHPSVAPLPYGPTSTYQVKVFDVAYRRDGDETWLARIYQPQGAGPFPALIDVHGGVWSGGDRFSNAARNEALAASGLLIAALDFRLAPRDPYPASVADVNYGTRWLKAQAPALGGDPRRLGGIGASSGGHLVMLSAMRPHDPRYTALPGPEHVDAGLAYVIACWPILDPYARYRFAQASGRPELVRGSEGYFLNAETMQEASPQGILDRGEPAALPPTLVLQGTADKNITMAMTERFLAAYRAAGGAIELERFPGMGHGFGDPPGANLERALELMKAFIARQLAAAGPASEPPSA